MGDNLIPFFYVVEAVSSRTDPIPVIPVTCSARLSTIPSLGGTPQLSPCSLVIAEPEHHCTVVEPKRLPNPKKELPQLSQYTHMEDLMRNRLLVPLFTAILTIAASVQGQTIPIIAKLDTTGTGNNSAGKGTFFGTFDVAQKSLTYQVTVNNLQGTISAAHFHDENTSVLQAITFSGNTAAGTWTNIPDSLFVKLVNQRIYVNVHTSFAGGGEIRGFTGAQAHAFGIRMDGAQAGAASNGRGTGYVEWDSASAKVRYEMTYAGLNAPRTVTHFHSARNGGIVQGITFVDSSASGFWTLPDTALNLLIKGELYVNIHTSFATGGEIRGAVVPYGEFTFTIAMDGAQASTASLAQGTGWASLDRFATKLKYRMTYAGLGSAFTAAHFHVSPGGGILQPITFAGNIADAEWTNLTDSHLRELLKGNVYVNIHTSVLDAGEIRGNLKYGIVGDGVWTATVDGATAGTISTAKGTAWLALYQDDSVKVRVTIAGLTSAFTSAHVHAGNTGILFGINFTDSTGTATAFRPDSVLLQLIKGQLYVNVHTGTFGGGEIRGNLKFGSGVVTGVQIDKTSDQIPASYTLDQNYPNPFNPTTAITFSVAERGKMTLKIYNLLGQVVATLLEDVKEAGIYSVSFDASGLTSGVYFYQLTTEKGSGITRRMVLLK